MNVGELMTPVVTVVDSILERNLAGMAALCRRHGVRLRPHVKTHNLPEITRRQVAAGLSGITVATLREARVMIESGMTDVFIARGVADAPGIRELLRLGRAASVSLAIDSAEAVARLAHLAPVEGRRQRLLIEVDVGGNRCGLTEIPDVLGLASVIRQHTGLELAGIFTHEGHVYAADSRPALQAQTAAAIERLRLVAGALRQSGVSVSVVSAGSSPSVKTATDLSGITEVRPGNYVFNDGMQVANGTATIGDCALRVVASVISRPAPGRAVLNVGSKTLGSDRGRNVSDSGGYGLALTPERLLVSRLYEEHAVVDAPNSLAVGDTVTLVPSHACIVANLAPVVYLVDDAGDVRETWQNRRFSPGSGATPDR